MNSKVVKTINIVLAIAVLFFAALSLKGALVTKYSSVQPLDASSVKIAQLSELGGKASLRAFKDYSTVLSGGLFAPASTLMMLGKMDSSVFSGEPKEKRMDSIESVKLVGTVVGAPLLGGYALFKDTKTSKQDIFKIGDDVFSVGRLKEVQKFSVVIVRSGTAYTIHMPETPVANGAAQSARGRISRRAPFGAPGTMGEPKAIAMRTGEKEWSVDRRALNETLNDMGKILTQARILPYMVRGETKGFRLSSVQRTGVFALMGLRSGDILLKVNDYSIDSPEKGIQLLSGLRGESSIELDILRGGKPTKLNYEIR
jgi:general secretion pathway protein C